MSHSGGHKRARNGRWDGGGLGGVCLESADVDVHRISGPARVENANLGEGSLPRCPQCGGLYVTRLQARGKTGKVRKLYRCLYCRRQFSATVGTIFHDSHMPLTDWLLVIYLMDSSKRRISAKEVERMLGVSYETAWNMHHRIGQAMEKEDQKAFLQKLVGVIGAQE